MSEPVVIEGDCVDVLAQMDEASIDAVVCDPPYSLGFMGREWDTHTGYENAALGYWLAGFIDGEGCFRVQRHERGTCSCTFSLKVRADERGTLEIMQRFVGAGTIQSVPGSGNASPQATWVVQDKKGCQRLVDLLDKYPLRAKKRIDFEAWAEAVCEWTMRKRGTRWSGPSDQTKMLALKQRIESGRVYREVPWSGNEFQDWCRLWAEQVLRVLKPGGHLLAFGGTRTYHRIACAIEDAGFEIRDSITWLYGSGFPKSLDVSKAIDKAAGAEREVTGVNPNGGRVGSSKFGQVVTDGSEVLMTAPATGAAQQWDGWGTALKPSHEPIVVARKPLAGTVAENVLQHGTGALNIDGCRISTAGEEVHVPQSDPTKRAGVVGTDLGISGAGVEAFQEAQRASIERTNTLGRWPANVVLSHSAGCRQVGEREVKSDGHHPAERGKGGLSTSGHGGQTDLVERAERSEVVEAWECVEGCPVAEIDRQSGDRPGFATQMHHGHKSTGIFGAIGDKEPGVQEGYNDEGGASRFFYVAKASRSEREEGLNDLPRQFLATMGAGIGAREHDESEPAAWVKNHHPTVKPVELMRYLVRLVTPPGGTVLDPFVGSGTTLVAACREGFDSIGIERDPGYAQLARARAAFAWKYLAEPQAMF